MWVDTASSKQLTRTSQDTVSLLMGTWRVQCCYFSGILAPNTEPKSNQEEITDKYRWRDILHNNWTELLKNVDIVKDKRKVEELF